jgi:hypothetical protein
MTEQRLEPLDPEQRRLRDQLLAQLKEAQNLQARVTPRRTRLEQLRHFIMYRRQRS